MSAEDTPLTHYNNTERTAAVNAKMIDVHPYSVIMLRAFGKGDDDDDFGLILSGWDREYDSVSKRGQTPGIRLWTGVVTLSTKNLNGNLPVADGKWSAGTWREADTWADGTNQDLVGTTIKTTAAGNTESFMIVPTLGLPMLLLEFTDMDGAGEANDAGLIWRPLYQGNAQLTL